MCVRVLGCVRECVGGRSLDIRGLRNTKVRLPCCLEQDYEGIFFMHELFREDQCVNTPPNRCQPDLSM